MYSLNAKNSKYFLIYLLAWIGSAVFLSHEADNFEKRMDSGFLTGIFTLNIICYTNLIFKMKLVYKFIDSADKIVEQS